VQVLLAVRAADVSVSLLAVRFEGTPLEIWEAAGGSRVSAAHGNIGFNSVHT
jgi:hypothetical protein